MTRSSCIEVRGRRTAAALLGAALAAATLLALPTAARAQTPGDSSAVDQYVEDVPTGAGNTAAGGGTGKKGKLPPQLATQIASEGGSDAALLEQVASSADYGAPASPRKATRPSDATTSGGAMERREGEPMSGDASDVSRTDAVTSALTPDGDAGSRLIGLLVVLFLMTLGATVVAGVRHRRAT